MLPFQDISNAKHIVLKVENDTFANASAIYTYTLMLHKKVSLFQNEKIESRFSFLPWYDKLRDSIPSSADLIIEISSDTVAYFHAFKKSESKINQKMATALYAGLLEKYNNFQNDATDGMVFASASELIRLEAEYKLCQEYLIFRVPLSVFRLKALLFERMLLVDEASVAQLHVSDADFVATGAQMKDLDSIVREVLQLVHVESVVIMKSDENNKIIKEESRFEK